MKYPIFKNHIEIQMKDRIAEATALLEALQAVKINTTHTKLTNRAIENGDIRDYMGIDKALFVPYTNTYSDGHTRYHSEVITAYSYTDSDGNELGTADGRRISRTMTPTELSKQLADIITARSETLKKYYADLERVATIVAEHNILVKQINTFNESLSSAANGARI